MRTELRRETLAQQVAQRLLEFIEEQRLGPGDPLASEAKLTQEFGVSRPVIREALRSLEAQGVIEIANGKGVTVKPITGKPMRDFFQRAVQINRETLIELLEIRRGIEIQSAYLAAQRCTDEDLAQMAQVLAAMRECLFDPEAYTKLDANLHLLVARASRNAILYHLVESVREPLQDTIRAGYAHSTREQKETLPGMHEAIVLALQSRNAEAATRAMAQHFDGAIMSHIHARAQDAEGATIGS